MRKSSKRRLVYLGLSIICFLACVLIVREFKFNHFIRGFTGDVIVISLIYFFLMIFHDFNASRLAVFTLLTAYLIEFMQYLKLAQFLGVENNHVARLVLGTVADPYDLLAYTIGAVLTYTLDKRHIRKILGFLK